MKIRIDIEGSPEDFQELFVPGDKQQEFIEMSFDAYTAALRDFIFHTIDPHNFIRGKKDEG